MKRKTNFGKKIGTGYARSLLENIICNIYNKLVFRFAIRPRNRQRKSHQAFAFAFFARISSTYSKQAQLLDGMFLGIRQYQVLNPDAQEADALVLPREAVPHLTDGLVQAFEIRYRIREGVVAALSREIVVTHLDDHGLGRYAVPLQQMR